VLIHPWDASLDDDEWRQWLADGRDFGQLAVNGPLGGPPVVVPTHFVVDGTVLLVHLARPNPVWPAIEAHPQVLLTVTDDYTFIPGTWRAKAGESKEYGVPTSYYTAVQFTCRSEIIDTPEGKAELLRQQLSHFQPAGDHADVTPDQAPYGRMLTGIRGLRLHIESVAAKFKYDDHKPQEHRTTVADRLAARKTGRDPGAETQQRRRLERIGTWQPQSES
jgi:transcriptional regulator